MERIPPSSFSRENPANLHPRDCSLTETGNTYFSARRVFTGRVPLRSRSTLIICMLTAVQFWILDRRYIHSLSLSLGGGGRFRSGGTHFKAIAIDRRDITRALRVRAYLNRFSPTRNGGFLRAVSDDYYTTTGRR